MKLNYNSPSALCAGIRGVLLALLLFGVFHFSSGARAAEPGYRDLFPDTWVATDALGRNMPTFPIVGPVKKDQQRVVGIFYITWHSGPLSTLKSPYTADVSKVLARDLNVGERSVVSVKISSR